MIEQRPLLAACMIVRNEAASLARCLHSLKGVVDEVVMVDTGSDDGTPLLAQSMGARVVVDGSHNDARGRLADVSYARNRALAMTCVYSGERDRCFRERDHDSGEGDRCAVLRD